MRKKKGGRAEREEESPVSRFASPSLASLFRGSSAGLGDSVIGGKLFQLEREARGFFRGWFVIVALIALDLGDENLCWLENILVARLLPKSDYLVRDLKYEKILRFLPWENSRCSWHIKLRWQDLFQVVIFGANLASSPPFSEIPPAPPPTCWGIFIGLLPSRAYKSDELLRSAVVKKAIKFHYVPRDSSVGKNWNRRNKRSKKTAFLAPSPRARTINLR